MYRATFNKSLAKQYMTSLEDGQPIKPSNARWTLAELLTLAGVCAHTIVSWREYLERVARPEYAKTDQEEEWRKQIVDEMDSGDLLRDLAEAVSWAEELCNEIMDGAYDKKYEEEVTAMIGAMRHITSGLKEVPEEEDDDEEDETEQP
jgi:hypothetical protein